MADLPGPVQTAVEGARFACLEGCGFCCTFPPAVTEERLGLIEQRAGRRGLASGPTGRRQLRVQGGCGGCVLLDGARQCTAYDLRPDHCRFFPFHVYFGRRIELCANGACPGLGPQGEPLDAAAQGAIAHVPEGVLAARAAEAAAVFADFERRARKARAWEPVDEALGALLDRGAALATREGLDELAGAVGLPDGGVFLARARRAFRGEDPFGRPTMTLGPPTFEWRTWHLRKDRFVAQRLEREGRTVDLHPVPSEPLAWDAAAVFATIAPLVRREAFVGMVFDAVDAEGYEITVGQAAALMFGEVVADLALRHHLLAHEPGAPPVTPRWLLQSYEHDFLDRPNIGGWL